jgi:hypothetical protein
MKIILLIPCILYFLGVVSVVDGADEHLRGSSRDLQYRGFGGDNDPPNPFIISTPTNPTQSSTSLSFQSPDQPNLTPENNSPGNNPFTSPINPTNLGFLQPAFNVGSINSAFGQPSGSTGSGSSTACESVRSKVRSGLVCPDLLEPVICEGGCQYDNSCKAEVAAVAGFAANQCRPNL